MSNLLTTAISDDFVWSAIMSAHAGRKKKRGNGHSKIDICCTMCVQRGETPDRKFRCAIWRNSDGVGVHCYNCNFITKFKIGDFLPKNMQDFLTSLGVESMEVKRMKHKALQYKRIFEANNINASEVAQESEFRPAFEKRSLPPGSATLLEWANRGCTDQNFIDVADYLFSRGDVVASAMEYYWTPEAEHQLNRRFIIPFRYRGEVVGYTARIVGSPGKHIPKYHSNVQENFLFNADVLEADRKFILITEGVLDGVAMDAVSTLGAKMTDEQAKWLNSSPKIKIMLADRDSAGARQIETALQHGWHVSFPKLREGHGFENWWEADVKDATEAVKRYGQLYVLRSVIESAVVNKIAINIRRKLLY